LHDICADRLRLTPQLIRIGRAARIAGEPKFIEMERLIGGNLMVGGRQSRRLPRGLDAFRKDGAPREGVDKRLPVADWIIWNQVVIRGDQCAEIFA
jgi:hypothetical protein